MVYICKMGNNVKCSPQARDAALEHFMPLYYTSRAVTQQDISLFQTCWDKIAFNQSIHYDYAYRNNFTACESCLTWFFHVFYARLFYVDPSCEPVFTQTPFLQGKFLLRLVTMLLSYREAGDQAKLEQINEILHITKTGLYQLGKIGEVGKFAGA